MPVFIHLNATTVAIIMWTKVFVPKHNKLSLQL